MISGEQVRGWAVVSVQFNNCVKAVNWAAAFFFLQRNFRLCSNHLVSEMHGLGCANQCILVRDALFVSVSLLALNSS